jgi:thiol:disulfide interchange protein DsbC
VFTDPDCPYCQRLEEELKSVSDVTMYLFMYPLKRIHPNAERHAKSIWCSEDSAKVWTAWVLDKKEPADQTCQNDPVDANLQLGEKLNVSGTPTLYFEDGSRETGSMDASDLEAKMTSAKKG